MKIGLNYVVRAGRYYHFRYTVPQDVRPFIGRTEIKKSLKTDSWQQAVGRAEQITRRTLELVKNVRKHKYLRRIGGLFNWAVKHEHLSTNPASGLQYKRTKRSDEERAPYSPENLQNLQAALIRLPEHCDPWKYWTPILAVYSGMRQNEIAQLHLDDIVDKNEVLCFDVNERGDTKKLKSKAARRLVPIHPHLVELGFLEYVEELRRQGEKRVWPALQEKRDGYGQRVSRWFSDWRKKWLTPEDLQQHKKDFHSFRHTFDDRLKQAGVLDVRLPQLMGHSLETDQTFGRYGELLRPPQLFEAIKLLDLGFALDKLRREWK